MGCLKLQEEKSRVLKVVYKKETNPAGVSWSSVQSGFNNAVGKINALFGSYSFDNQGLALNFNFEARPFSQYGTRMLYSNITLSITSGHGDPCPSCDQAQLALDVAGIFDPSGAIDVTNGGWYWKRGKYLDASISFLSVFPLLDFLKAGRLGKAALKLSNKGGTSLVKGFTKHATNQALTRGFKTADILKIVKEGNSVQAMGRYGLQTRYVLGGNTVILNAQGKIITVFSNAVGNAKGVGKGFFIPFNN